MTKEIYQIEQGIAKLEQQTLTITEQLKSNYQNYLNKLGEYVQKYLIFAAYQICTQTYPQAFLNLSLNQRQAFQQTVSNLGKQAQTKLSSLLDTNVDSQDYQSENDSETTVAPELTAQIIIAEDPLDANLTVNNDAIDLEASVTKSEPTKITNPEELVIWIKKIEKNITDILQMVSNDVNKLLLKESILPQQLPSKVLEAAAKIDSTASSTSGRPNLLNLLVESGKDSAIEKDKVKKNSEVTKITAIYLRLAEIEFAETTLSSQRNQIREILARVKKLRKQYQKTQQELAIAQAEAAWRSSWYEE